jgi:hypothetical protein
MTRKRWAAVFIFAAMSVSTVSADILTSYTINFAPIDARPPLLPTAASFTYDETAPRFTSFFVIWDGLTFDFTSSPLADLFPTPTRGCLDGTNDAEAIFDLLSGDCGLPLDEILWGGVASGNGAHFEFQVIGDTAPGELRQGYKIEADLSGIAGVSPGNDQGTWTITSLVVPEPSAFILLSTALLSSTIVRKRIARKDTEPTTK